MKHAQLGFHLSSGFFTQKYRFTIYWLSGLCWQDIPEISGSGNVLQTALQRALSAFILRVGTRWRLISVVFCTSHWLELCSHPADHFHHHPETEEHNSACQLLFWILYFLAGILYLVLVSTYGVSVGVLYLVVLYCCILYRSDMHCFSYL
jgi:hypothetical protein